MCTFVITNITTVITTITTLQLVATVANYAEYVRDYCEYFNWKEPVFLSMLIRKVNYIILFKMPNWNKSKSLRVF